MLVFVLVLASSLALGAAGCGSSDPVEDAADENTQEFEENVEQQSSKAAEDAESAVDEMNEQIDEAEGAMEDQ
jgi:hypothetical protein